jgi:tRNA (guanine37-N1)-methyltransferase
MRGSSSFDSVGDIAIIETPKMSAAKEKAIAKAFLSEHPYFKVVAKKAGGHVGKYRVQHVKVLAGEKRTHTVHTESGLQMEVDVNTAYFSPRLSTERLRIARMVKAGEKVLVLFSGVGPYTLVLAKHSPARNVVGIELNPAAHKLAVKNILRNKLSARASAIKADAKKWCMKTTEKFDRIIMPLPASSVDFLPAALRAAETGATLHVYTFAHEDAFDHAAQQILDACTKAGVTCKLNAVVKSGQQSPRTFRICVEITRTSRGTRRSGVARRR